MQCYRCSYAHYSGCCAEKQINWYDCGTISLKQPDGESNQYASIYANMTNMIETPLATRTVHGTTFTRMGLGLAALGRPAYINLGHADDLQRNYAVAAMQQHATAMLDEAWAAGVRYFDAARSYGRAEQFLGAWLRDRQHDPAQVVVGSKWGYTYTANWQIDAAVHEVKEHSLPVLQRQWHESQHELGGYLRLYQIHSATLDSGVLDNTAVLAELARLKATGIHIGLSVSGAQQADVIAAALAVEHDGTRLFDLVQVTWNVLETSTTAILQQAHAAGVGVIVKEGVANGRLTPRGLDTLSGTQRARLTYAAAALDTTVDAVALAAVLAQPWATLVLSGAARPEHLHANLHALSLTPQQLAPFGLDTLTEPPADYWARRKALPWN